MKRKYDTGNRNTAPIIGTHYHLVGVILWKKQKIQWVSIHTKVMEKGGT